MKKAQRLMIVFIVLLSLFSSSLINKTLASDFSTPPTREEITQFYHLAVVKIEHWTIGGDSRDWSGSGVFFTPKKIITNSHVVGSLMDILTDNEFLTDSDLRKAIFWIVFEGKRYRAHCLGRDPELDLAILETDHQIPGVQPAPLGNSNEAMVGEQVFAIGSPFGLENSITGGVVSAKQRITGLIAYEDYLQTDAPINPGNSGGPLVSLKTGKVIGIINSGIPSADGMGFAIPINLFKEQELSCGTVKRGWLGIKVTDLQESEDFQGLLDIYKQTGINDISLLQKIRDELFHEGGILLTNITETVNISPLEKSLTGKQFPPQNNTPAVIAGLQTNDIIKQVSCHRIKTARDLSLALMNIRALETITIEVVRFEGNKRTVLTLDITPLLRTPSRAGESY